MTDRLNKHVEAMREALGIRYTGWPGTDEPVQRNLLTAVQAIWNEAYDVGALTMREAGANKARSFYIAPPPRSKAAQYHERNVKDILADAISTIDPDSLRNEQ